MSAYTTVYLRRAQAIQYVLSKLYNSSDEELERITDEVLRSRLYNCRIVHTSDTDDWVLDV